MGEDDDEEARYSAQQVSAIVASFAERHLAGLKQLEELIMDFIQPLSIDALSAVAAVCPTVNTLKLTYADPDDFANAKAGTKPMRSKRFF